MKLYPKKYPEKYVDSIEDILDYTIDGNRLRDIITLVNALWRNI